MTDNEGSDNPEEEGESEEQDVSGDTSKQEQESASKAPDSGEQPKDASASSSDPTSKEKNKPAIESHKDWFTRVTNEGHEVLWPKASAKCPTLLTGVKPTDSKSTADDLLGWERKLETANLEKHMQYLRERQFAASQHPMEATACENGFVPETQGLPSDQLESRILPLLPQLSHMVSAPRQPIAAGNSLDLMPMSDHTGYVIGSLALVDILRCMNIELMGRQGGNIQWRMWCVLGPQPLMHVCASL